MGRGETGPLGEVWACTEELPLLGVFSATNQEAGLPAAPRANVSYLEPLLFRNACIDVSPEDFPASLRAEYPQFGGGRGRGVRGREKRQALGLVCLG